MSPGNTPARELHLNSNVLNSGKHDHGWRLQDDPLSYLDIRYYQRCAQVAERGTLDAIFLADGVAIGPEAGARPWNSLEPTVVLAAIAAVTERVGLVATASTTFNEPYNLARRFASLDQISAGRAAVNIVTSLDARSAANFSLGSHPDAAERYARAEEFVDVLIKLWDSWEDGALVADQQSGVFADIGRVHAIDHRGEHFSVAGPLNVPRAPQGRPVIVQAGSSEAGRRLAARTGRCPVHGPEHVRGGAAVLPRDQGPGAALRPRSGAGADPARTAADHRQHGGRGSGPAGGTRLFRRFRPRAGTI